MAEKKEETKDTKQQEPTDKEPTDDESPKLGPNVFFALAAIGWADGNLDQDEADAIVRTALEEGLDLEQVAAIEEATKKPVDLGDVRFGKMSKADRLFVYAVASWMARLDGAVTKDEVKALDELGTALHIPAKPREHADRIAVEIGKLGESDKAPFYNLPKLRRTLKVRLTLAKQLRAAQKPDDSDDDEDDDE